MPPPSEEIIPEGVPTDNKKKILVIVIAVVILAVFVGIYLKARKKPVAVVPENQAAEVASENKPAIVVRTETATTTDGQGRQVKSLMTAEEAFAVASDSVSECSKDGAKLENNFYNENTKTWWFDSLAKKSGCNPACVVSENVRAAEINWRCTGANFEYK